MENQSALNRTAKAAINLNHLGIYTTVLTTLGDIEDVTEIFKNSPDASWCNGFGKDHLYRVLLRKLKFKDDYFNKNPKKVKASNQKWIDFCNDCLFVYVLDSMRNDSVFRLVHPTCYSELINGPSLDGTTGNMPDHIEGIPTLQL
jgi:hypothetical protein